MRGFPCGPYSICPTSSGSPSIQAAKPGAASRLFSCMASAKRSFDGIERLQVEHADLRDRRRLDLLDQAAKIEVLPLPPGAVENRRKQDVLAALDRIGVDADQPEQAGHRRADALAQQLGVVEDLRRRRGERFEDRHRQSGVAARRVDGEVGRVAQSLDALAVLSPLAQALLPQAPPAGPHSRSETSPFLRASSSLIQGAKSSPRSSGNVSSRLARSPLGSMTMAGMPSIAASSSSPMQRPVLPLPVMPTHTAWVTRSFES